MIRNEVGLPRFICLTERVKLTKKLFEMNTNFTFLALCFFLCVVVALGRKPVDPKQQTYHSPHGHEEPTVLNHHYDCMADAKKLCPRQIVDAETDFHGFIRCVLGKAKKFVFECKPWVESHTPCVDDVAELCHSMGPADMMQCLGEHRSQVSRRCQDSSWFKHLVGRDGDGDARRVDHTLPHSHHQRTDDILHKSNAHLHHTVHKRDEFGHMPMNGRHEDL
jgi:hypothetical protein